MTATDLVLTVTEMLRNHGVVEKFVEFFGSGMKKLAVPDRATISNMSPEYGATMGFFPVDEKTIDYLVMTNREQQAEVVENCTKMLGLYYSGSEDPDYTEVLELDLAQVTPAVAGPARPQDRINLSDLKQSFGTILGCDYERDTDVEHISKYHDESGSRTTRPERCMPKKKVCEVPYKGQQIKLCDGNIVIAAITSCTNTSNPAVLLGAGLVAKRAVERGLQVPIFVKTSLAPGSKVVIDYLQDAGLMPFLEALGFHLAAFGCTTCIGNSGPLPPEIDAAISKNDLTVAAVLSGNRNFEARIHQRVKANFLASPMLVVAFALAGRIDIDFAVDPLGLDANEEPVFLKDIWPDTKEITKLVTAHVKQQFYKNEYDKIFEGDEFWRKLQVTESTTFDWDKNSTYIKKPPYFDGFKLELDKTQNVKDARALLVLGDSVTTDHISPAGAIPPEYPAGKYLIENKVAPQDFNSYGSRRGNHEVMMRGTFGNIRIKNQMVGEKEGSYTLKYPARDGNVRLRCSHGLPGAKPSHWWYWEAKNTVPALRGIGPPKAPACWALKPLSPNLTSGSIAAISSAWVPCRWCSKRVKTGTVLAWTVQKHFPSVASKTCNRGKFCRCKPSKKMAGRSTLKSSHVWTPKWMSPTLKTTAFCLMFYAKYWKRAKVMEIKYNATLNFHHIIIRLNQLVGGIFK